MFDDQHLRVFINEVYENYGYDFAGYSHASFKRRLERVYQMDAFVNFQEFLYKINNDVDFLTYVIEEITVNVTEMFRDPSFYKVIREEILPALRSKPFIRIWHAGCSTGQEVYSMAILLNEEGLLSKSLIYATDINATVLDTAKKGLYPLKLMKEYAENYRDSGGKEDFSGYYTANYGFAKFDDHFSKKMVFSQHNLVSDSSFNEFDLILCRNVMIYFDKDLQERVLHLLNDSMAKLGYLILGTKETIKYTEVDKNYEQLPKRENMEEDQINFPEKVVTIGGSAGSLEVILQLLPELADISSIAIVLILHRRNSDDSVLEELLRMKSGLNVTEIEDKTPIKPGGVYVAPADYHLLFETDLTFSLDVSEKVHYSRPSIDVGFESAADVFKDKLTAILLSGANHDGTDGLLTVKKKGGTIIIQSPETAEVPFMPANALKHVKADYVLSPTEISVFINGLA